MGRFGTKLAALATLSLLGCGVGATGTGSPGLGAPEAGRSGTLAVTAPGGTGGAGQADDQASVSETEADGGAKAVRMEKQGGAGEGAAGKAASRSASKADCVAPAFSSSATTCHRDMDCGAGATCQPVEPFPQTCGSPCPGCVTDRCMTDADCANGVCDPSKQFPGLINQCTPRCSSTSCVTGERCETDGRCRPILCSVGFTCAVHTRCSVGSMLADAHGCEPIACNEPGGAQCAAPSVCTRESPRQPTAANGCAIVPCADPRHPGCAPNTRCRPELESSGNYGCTRMTCKSDMDCDCGGCIVPSGSDGLCYDHVGVCVPPAVLNCPP